MKDVNFPGNAGIYFFKQGILKYREIKFFTIDRHISIGCISFVDVRIFFTYLVVIRVLFFIKSISPSGHCVT